MRKKYLRNCTIKLFPIPPILLCQAELILQIVKIWFPNLVTQSLYFNSIFAPATFELFIEHFWVFFYRITVRNTPLVVVLACHFCNKQDTKLLYTQKSLNSKIIRNYKMTEEAYEGRSFIFDILIILSLLGLLIFAFMILPISFPPITVSFSTNMALNFNATCGSRKL